MVSREHYLTYFQPYFHPEAVDGTAFFQEKDYEKNQTKKSFLYQILRVGFDEDGEFIRQLGSMIIAKSFLQNIEYRTESEEQRLIRDCGDRKLDVINVASPLVTNSFNSGKYNRLRFLCNTNKMYLYIVSTKIESLRDLSKRAGTGGFKVSIDSPESMADLFCKDVMESLGFVRDTDYRVIYTAGASSKEALQAVSDESSDMGFLSLPFHPKLFQEEMCAVGKQIFLLPFALQSETKTRVFFQKNFYYISDIYDLNDVCASYLPKKYGGKKYTRFYSQIPIVSYYNALVTHDGLDDKMTYEILRTFYENIDLFNQLPVFHRQPMRKTGLAPGPQNTLPISNGSRRFFIERGYIGFQDNPGCMSLVGVQECTPNALRANGFLEGDTPLDPIFRMR
jgi:TRAP-type uncharacterized transport system substrate-binding protein